MKKLTASRRGLSALHILFAALAVGLLFLSQPLLPVAAQGKAATAQFAPASAPFYLALNLDLTQISGALRILDIYSKAAPMTAGEDDPRQQLQDALGLDWDSDILPWIGPEVGLFFTDLTALSPQLTNGNASSNTPNLVFAIGTRSVTRSNAALDKTFEHITQQGGEVVRSIYNDIEIMTALDASSDSPMFLANVPGYVLLASSRQALQTALDMALKSGSSNLASSERFTRALDQLPNSRTATLYLPFSTVTNLQGELPLPPTQSLGGLAAADALAGGLAFTDDGLRLDMAVTLDPARLTAANRALLARPAVSNTILAALPARSSLVFTGVSLKQAWETNIASLEAAEAQELREGLAEAEQELGINIEDDILSWMTGEFAFAVTPSQSPLDSAFGFDLLALFEIADRTVVEAKVKKVQAALTEVGLTFQPQRIDGMELHVISPADSPSGTSLAMGFISRFFVIGTPPEVFTTAVSASLNPITNDPIFKRVQSNLPAQNSGLVYVNVDQLYQQLNETFLPLVTGSMPGEGERQTEAVLNPIQALGFASEAAGRTDAIRSTLYIAIQAP